MKKLLLFLRILLTAAFIGAFALLVLSLIRIEEGKARVEIASGKMVEYFSDEAFFYREYYKYEDSAGVQYWLSAHEGRLSIVQNTAFEAIDSASETTEDSARQMAYKEAAKYDKDFFAQATICKRGENSEYEFYIFQLDDLQHINGKFIKVKITDGKVHYIKMHTFEDTIVSQSYAVDKAFAINAAGTFQLKKIDNHLIETKLLTGNEKWTWQVHIYAITGEDIAAQKEPIDTDSYFSCEIDAFTGEVILGEWVMTATDYCPLDGSIF